MQRDVIKPQPDIPVIVRLDKGPEGQEREGRYGVDYQYTVNHDQGVMWLPREARDQLVRCGAQAGDEVQIVKSLRGRQAFWSVQVVPDSNEPVPPPPPSAPVPLRTNGQAQRPAMPNHIAAFCAAVDTLRAVAEYAKQKYGFDLNWNEEDYRCVGTTLYIRAQEKGGR